MPTYRLSLCPKHHPKNTQKCMIINEHHNCICELKKKKKNLLWDKPLLLDFLFSCIELGVAIVAMRTNKLAPSIHVVKHCHKLIYWFSHIHDASHTRSCLELRKCVFNLWLNNKGPLFILALLIYSLQMIGLATMGVHWAK